MPEVVYIPTGAIEPIKFIASSITGARLPGKADIRVKIYRDSDGRFLDWSDSTFKPVGSVITLLTAMAPIDNTNLPGVYLLLWDTSTIMNPTVDDTYLVTVVQTPGTDIVGLPIEGEIRSGGFVDEAILTRKLLENNQDLDEGSVDNLTIWDDDDVTVLRRWDITDKNGLGISLDSAVPAKRRKS